MSKARDLADIEPSTLATDAEVAAAVADKATDAELAAAVSGLASTSYVDSEIAAAVAGITPGGHTLLGSLTTTSGSSHTLNSLDLSGYKFVRVVIDGMSASSTASLLRFAATNARICVPSPADVTNVSYGIFDIDLSDGMFASCVVPFSGSTPAAPSTGGGSSGITTASTSIGINLSTGTFDAGSVRFYGVT